MRITLVLCPQSNPDKPPLSLAYLAATLIEHGMQVHCFDFNIELYAKQSAEKKQFWEGRMEPLWSDPSRLKETGLIDDTVLDSWVDMLEKTSPDVVGFSLLTTSLLVTLQLAEKLKGKRPDLKIVFGGPEVYRLFGLGGNKDLDCEALHCADALIIGEGEDALLRALLSLKKNGFFSPGEGIMAREGAKFIGSENTQLIHPLDSIPFPRYELFPLALYRERGQFPLLFSRGCIGKCAFCFEQAYWKRFRQRSVDNVVQEIRSIRKRFGIYCFSLNDSLMNGNMHFLRDFCEKVISESIEVNWWGMARVNALMTEAFIHKMKQAGCRGIAYGIESGSQNVLNLMKKNTTVSIIDEAILNTWKGGIKPGINLLLGFPGETDDDFLQTCDLIKRHGEHIAYVNVTMLGIEPFTEVHKTRQTLGITMADTPQWQTSDGKNNSEMRRERASKLSEIIERYVGKTNNLSLE